VAKNGLTIDYETHQATLGLKEGCIGKLDRCTDHKFFGKLHVNKTVVSEHSRYCDKLYYWLLSLLILLAANDFDSKDTGTKRTHTHPGC
jgi:hypothetical protein